MRLYELVMARCVWLMREQAIMMNKIHAMQSEVRRDLDQAITSAIRPFLTDAVDIRLQKYFRYLFVVSKHVWAAD